MPEFSLILRHSDGPSEQFRIGSGGVLIGRSQECDIYLTDRLVSRHHARVQFENGGLEVKDLDSRNGIEVNGDMTKSAHLSDGDELRIGNTVFNVLRHTDSGVLHASISPEEAKKLHDSILREGRNDRLTVLYSAAQLLGSVFDLDELLNDILQLVARSLDVPRGYILTIPDEGGDPVVRASIPKGDFHGPPISQTLIRHVVDERSAILTMNAQEDSRFDATESIVDHEIRAAMCAPMPVRDQVIGILYVDSGSQSRQFTEAELELLTAIGRVVAVAVQNARLYRENMERERLATIGEATAGLGHCVKNILTGIRGGAEFVNNALAKEDLSYLKKGWPILSQAVDRIDMLVMNLLTIGKEREPEKLVTDLVALTRDVFQVVQPRADNLGVTLHVEPEDAPIRCEVDARQIYRVILNLVTNAIDAMEQTGGHLRVVCAQDVKECAIRVEDEGIGIPPDILPELSKAFVSSKGSKGTGLGLACSYKIVREHGGAIDVANNPPKGTVFMVRLPNATDERQTTTRRRTVGEVGTVRSARSDLNV